MRANTHTRSKSPAPQQKWPWKGSIFCHAWNPNDSSVLALAASPEPQTILIISYQTQTILHKLQKHTARILDLDWHENKLVSCAEDKHVFVWDTTTTSSSSSSSWTPSLVILKTRYTPTYVQWNPYMGEKTFLCHTDLVTWNSQEQFWAGTAFTKKNKKVTAGKWSPDGTIVATAASDGQVKLFRLDKNNQNHQAQEYKSYKAQAWITDLAFSPSGNRLAFSSQDSIIHIVDLSRDKINKLRLHSTPFHRLLFTKEDCIIATGHQNDPTKIICDQNNNWTVKGLLTPINNRQKKQHGTIAKARAILANKVDKGTDGAETGSLAGDITCLTMRDENTVSTSAADGKFVLWQLGDE